MEVDGATTNFSNGMKALEVLLLDSDDEKDPQPSTAGNAQQRDSSSDSSVEIQEPKKRRRMVWQCLEPDCTNARKAELITANSYVLSLYNMTLDDKKKRKICVNCNERVLKEKARLVDKVNSGRPLLDEMFPVPRDCVMLEDSDEKSETDESESTEFELDFSSNSSDEGLTAEQIIEKQMKQYLDKINVDSQIQSSIDELSKRMNEQEKERKKTDKMYNELEALVDATRKELYSEFDPQITHLPPLDIPIAYPVPVQQPRLPAPLPQQHPLQPRFAPLPHGPLRMIRPVVPTTPPKNITPSTPPITPPSANRGIAPIPIHRPVAANSFGPRPDNMLPYVPPQGPLERPPLTIGTRVFHLRGQNSLVAWKDGTVEEILSSDGEITNYKIKSESFLGGKKIVQSKLRNLKQLAYSSVAKVKIPVETRVIGLYRENREDKGAFYAGIIAEPPKSLNKNRYLVFFDDGVAKYLSHKELRVVCQTSPIVTDDIHPNSRDFIKNYFSQYPERPMVKLNVGQVVKTEYEGKWHITRVKEVDSSLVKLMFDQDNRTEWIYRGSTRLGPLFTELENQKKRKAQGATQAQRRQRGMTAQIIEYTRQLNDQDLALGAVDADGAPTKKLNVARKSMGNRRSESNSAAGQPLVKWEYEGQINQVDVADIRSYGIPFRKHGCSEKCIDNQKFKYNEDKLKGTNPLLIPLIVGWNRQITKIGGKGGNIKQKSGVMYTSPCGRRLRNLEEVHRYLRITKSNLEIDFFNYEWFVKVFDEWSPKRTYSHIRDLSYGRENVPISCVNSVDKSFPEYVEYSTVRIPKDKVFINTDPEFLVGCNCVDDCQDKESCSCHQLTIQATACSKGGKINPNVGYKFRRLYGKRGEKTVSTGIYECNSQCKCAKTCLNRVAQHPLRNKLQVFKTEKRGWGVRTLCDIPDGAFICIYVGNLFEAEEGNKQGQNFGDEYFADLDMIEIVERNKEGYESDVSEDEEMTRPETKYSSFPKPTFPSKPADFLSSEEDDEDDTSGEKSTDKDFNPSHSSRHSRPRGTDRVSRSRIPQTDGGETTSGSEAEESPSLRGSLINDLIHKPDPFQNNMVRRLEGSLREGQVSVLYPSQVDGNMDDSDEDDMEILEEKRPIRSGFTATPGIMGPKKPKNTETFKSTRKFFGHAEEAYIMDAKSIGNIGRYLNHSCNPNCIVQSVFVDTHDVRFHWVAFFADVKIDAGTELSWDYNYETGCIPGKELYCECGGQDCRGRLL